MEYLYFTPQGIFADVRWTDKAAEYIKNGEYRYISAVFAYDTEGYVRKIFHAALTNTPALDGMDEAMVAASVQLLNEEAQEMDKELLAMLCSLFGVASATETEIKEKVTALSQAKGESKVVLSDVYSALKEKEQSVAALSEKVNAFDPSKYVPVEQVVALQNDFNAFKDGVEKDKKSALIQTALSEGKLAPALKEWAEGLSVEALTGYLEKATPVAALSGEPQSKGDPNNNVVALSESEKAAAKALGMSESEFRKAHKEIN